MKIELHPDFKKSYKKRISNNPKLILKTAQRIKLFQSGSNSPILKDHQLKGSKNNLRAFSINGDMRIVYLKISAKHIILFDIGTHNLVY